MDAAGHAATAKEAAATTAAAATSASASVVRAAGPMLPARLQIQCPADLSRRAAAFRSRLLEEFRVEEMVNTDSRSDPKHTTSELFSVEDPSNSRLRQLLLQNPDQLVGFKIFKRSLEARLQITQDKRMARVKSLHSLPLGVWAKAVLTSRLFSWLMVSLIVLTAVVQAVQTELSRESYPKLYSALQTADDIATLMFAVEIALKWLDSFQRFWHDRWNVFDLVITALALAPMVLSMTLYGSSWSGARALNGELRVLRSLRVLKLVARMTSLRVVVATIFEALQSLGFILLLLVLLTFLFAVFAISLFERYTQSERSDLEYQSRFKNLPNTLVTLFQLLTLDQWYIMQRDVERVVHPALTIVFFLFWVWLGGLVFRNVFVGVMVRKFDEMTAEVRQQLIAARREQQDKRDLTTLNKQIQERNDADLAPRIGASHSGRGKSVHFAGDEPEPSTKQPPAAQTAEESEEGAQMWLNIINNNMHALRGRRSETMWPRDVLLEYMVAMERLQNAMREFELLQSAAADALMRVCG